MFSLQSRLQEVEPTSTSRNNSSSSSFGPFPFKGNGAFATIAVTQKNCETCSFQSMLHSATIRATCVATELRDKLQEKLRGVTAPLRIQPTRGPEGVRGKGS